jgi:hypothetical protein
MANRAASGVDVVVSAFASLAAEEQEEAYARIVDVRLTRLADAEGETAEYIRALRGAADLAGGELTTSTYKSARRELLSRGEGIPDLSSVIRFFGSWALAKEALALNGVSTTHKIEARFRSRVAGRQRHFMREELDDALARCVAELGRVPLLSEFGEWRGKELALMRVRGGVARVPSASVFRRRYGSWEKALLAHGHCPEEVYARLESTPARRAVLAKVDRYSEATLRETLFRCALAIGHAPLIAEFTAWRARELKRACGKRIILPTDSPYRYRFGTWEKALLHFGFTPEQVAARLEAGRGRSSISLRWHQFSRRDRAGT